MLQIIQDYKDWKMARKATAIRQQNLSFDLQDCHVYPCAYNVRDTMFYETFCVECSAFNMIKAQEKQNQAKRKLLDNFRFWKQKEK